MRQPSLFQHPLSPLAIVSYKVREDATHKRRCYKACLETRHALAGARGTRLLATVHGMENLRCDTKSLPCLIIIQPYRPPIQVLFRGKESASSEIGRSRASFPYSPTLSSPLLYSGIVISCCLPTAGAMYIPDDDVADGGEEAHLLCMYAVITMSDQNDSGRHCFYEIVCKTERIGSTWLRDSSSLAMFMITKWKPASKSQTQLWSF
jgi:hypothetical protein